MCCNDLFRLFCDAVANFQSGQEEISLIATPLKLTVKNYVDDEPGAVLYRQLKHLLINLDTLSCSASLTVI